MLNTPAILLTAADLIESEGLWKGSVRRNLMGEVLDPEYTLHGCCVVTACAAVTRSSTGGNNATDHVERFLGIYGDAYSNGVISWNDQPERTKAEVVTALRTAATWVA